MTQKTGCDITGWFIYTMYNSPMSLFGDLTWPSPSRTENTRISIIFLVYQVLGANKKILDTMARQTYLPSHKTVVRSGMYKNQICSIL